MKQPAATVFLIGAGPGDPELITLYGLTLIQSADVIVHDRLVSPDLVAQARLDAIIINVGKAPSKRRFPQSEINQLLVQHGLAGRKVVRLKGGDPFVFGLGGDECAALEDASIPYEIVPGVSSVIAVPAYAGIPVTHRGISSSLYVLSGHDLTNREWEQLPQSGTIVILMGIGKLAQIVALLQKQRLANTPVALIQSGSTAAQVVVTGTLETIVSLGAAAGIIPPAMIVVGDVVTLREQLAWFTNIDKGNMQWFDPVKLNQNDNRSLLS